jgi:phosphohistidine phosphatase SixA
MIRLSRFIPLLALLICGAVAAQSPAPAGTPPPAKRMLPEIDPKVELKGAALRDALLKGGFNLYMRHGEQIKDIPEDCTKPNLTEAGQATARKVGAGLRAAKVPVGSVLSSPRCRAQETARLLEAGKVELNTDIDYFEKQPSFKELEEQRVKRLGIKPAAGTNTLLVGHQAGSPDLTRRLQLELGEIIVLQPDGKGGTVAVARIQSDQWDQLTGSQKK